MKFNTLEQEFSYYSNVFQWHLIFSVFENRKRFETLSMSKITDLIINSFISGTIGGISGAVTTEIINKEEFKNFLLKVTKKAQSEGKLIIKNLRSFNGLRMALVFAEIYKILEENNIQNSEIKPITEKILIPVIELISEDENIENSENIKIKWAKLLTSEIQGQKVHPKFLDFMKNLEKKDAIVLDCIYNLSNSNLEANREELLEKLGKSSWTHEEMEVSLDILIGEGICRYGDPVRYKSFIGDSIILSRIGKKFMSLIN